MLLPTLIYTHRLGLTPTGPCHAVEISAYADIDPSWASIRALVSISIGIKLLRCGRFILSRMLGAASKACQSFEPNGELLRQPQLRHYPAFLSATSDDSLKVMAVCVEERCNGKGKGITIRLAANTGDLSTVTAGFVRLARVLEHAARRGRSKSEDTEEAFREVVSLDLDRILSRLRSRHAKLTRKTAGKRPLIEQLHDTIHSRSIRATKTLEESRRRVEDLQSLFASLESITNPGMEIIEVPKPKKYKYL